MKFMTEAQHISWGQGCSKSPHHQAHYMKFLYSVHIWANSVDFHLQVWTVPNTNINNVLIITGDFNIRDNIWDPLFLHHSIHRNLLFDITDSLNLCISKATNPVSTRYIDNQEDSNLNIDLMFLQPNSSELNNHTIHPEWRLLSDHAPLVVDIMIFEKFV